MENRCGTLPVGGPREREGASVVEALVALLLALLLARVGWSVLASQRRAAEGVALGAEAQEVGRTVRRVLALELRTGVSGADWRTHSGDSLTLRAFRGAAVACHGSAGPERQWTVAYQGFRAPEPEKDSVLVLDARGRWRGAELSSAQRWDAACSGGSWTEGYKLTLDRALENVVFFRLFERGSYHLAGGAFRYRIGLGGRQPLTPERLTSSSGLEGGEGHALLLLDYRWVAGISRPLPERWTLRSLSR